MICRTRALPAHLTNSVSQTAKSFLAAFLIFSATIAAWAQASATFVWLPNHEPDLMGYRFYQEYGQPVKRTVTKLGLVTRHTASNLLSGETYRFYLTAVNTAGLESDPSDVVVLTAGTRDEPAGGDASVIVIDDADSYAVSLTGDWRSTSASPGYWATGYLHDRTTDKGAKTATYTANLPASGLYEVALWYIAGSNRASTVPVDIFHADGTSRVVVDQRVNGSQWHTVGTFAFSSARLGRVRIGTEGTSGYVMADAVRWLPAGQLAPQLAASPATLSAQAISGHTASMALELWNAGGGTLDFELAASVPWLQLSRASGSSTGQPLTVTVSAITTGLAPGTHAGSVQVTPSDPAAGSPLVIPVDLEVIGATPTSSDLVIVIDDSNHAAVSLIGDWRSTDSIAGYWGDSYLHDRNRDKGAMSVDYTAALPASGLYEVAIWYNAGSNRATTVPVDIFHAGGANRVLVNQRLDGSQWNTLGTFTFDAAHPRRVRISNEATSGTVIADAVRLRFIAPLSTSIEKTLILDNADPNGVVLIGDWRSTDSIAGYWGDSYLHDRNRDKGAMSVDYTAALPASGLYEVAIWYNAGSNRATTVPVDIFHARGANRVLVNQRLDGSQWNTLGTFTFDAAHLGRVRISNEATSGTVIADAVRLRFIAPLSTSIDETFIVDNADPNGVVLTGDWRSTDSIAGYWGDSYLHDRNRDKGALSVDYTAALPTSGLYEVAIWYNAGSNRATTVPVDIFHARGANRVLVNQRLDGSQWNTLGTFTFDAAHPGRVRISNEATSGTVIADAVRFHRVSTAVGEPAIASVAGAANPAPDPFAAPHIRITPLTQIGQGLDISWPTVAGTRYDLEQATSLHGDWTVTRTVHGTGEAVTVNLPIDVMRDRQSFLRLKSHPDMRPASDLPELSTEAAPSD